MSAPSSPAPSPPVPPLAAPPPPALRTGPLSTQPPGRGLLARAFEWCWRGAAIERVRRTIASTPNGVREFERRARVSAELARHALEPSETFAAGSARALAAELYRQSAYWALKAAAEAGFEHAVFVRAAGSESSLAGLRSSVEGQSFVELAELAGDEQARIAQGLRHFSEALLAELDLPVRALDALWLQRALRVGGILALLAALLGTGLWLSELKEKRADFARGKPWRASSTFPAVGCRSPEQQCADSPDFFFHTDTQANPWLLLDLGSAKTFSAVRIVNRKDCCFDRAAPLIVEVSKDEKQWRAVARQPNTFSSWLARFRPVEARFVRLRVTKNTAFHLATVRVLP